MNNTYKNLVLTDHALNRVRLRSLRKEAIRQTLLDPDKHFPQKEGKIKAVKKINHRQYHVVAKQTGQDQWLIISVWVRGEEDPLPLAWRIISFPFRAVWWLIKRGYRAAAADD